MTDRPRIVILGANGQVAAEVVCRLIAVGADVVPVCRSHRGSAFLRSRGIAVRHGAIDKVSDAARLVGDADLVANFALALGKPSEMRDGNNAIIGNALDFSPSASRHVFFSTLAVNPELVPDGAAIEMSSYGREKLRNERLAAHLARRLGKSLLILRLGHVTGALQGISAEIADRIAAGAILLPDPNRLANVTDTSTIARALWDIAVRDQPTVGRFDLTESPPRRWIDVLNDESARCGQSLKVQQIDLQPVVTRTSWRALAGTAKAFAFRSSTVRRIGTRILNTQSLETNHRVRAAYAVNAARSSIVHLRRAPNVMSSMTMPGLAIVPFGFWSDPTITLGTVSSALPEFQSKPFPDDLPGAAVVT